MTKSRRNFIKSGIGASMMSYLGFNNSFRNKIFSDSPTLHQNENLFLLKEDRKYFNTASLGASPKMVVQTLNEWNLKLESISETGHQHIKECRKAAAEFFNCYEDELAITRNTTEGINIIAQGLTLQPGDEVILSTHEHVGCAVPWMNMVDQKGIKLKLVDLDLTGSNNLDIIKNAVTEKTKVISISHVTCTNGMILPIKDLVTWCREKGILTCIDGAQALGMIDIDMKDMDPDFYATSGHKWLYGPKGTGFLFINKKSIHTLHPTFAGAYTTESYNLNELKYSYLNVASREEYGTRNTPLVMSLKAAMDFHKNQGREKIVQHGLSLAGQLKSSLRKVDGIEILSPDDGPFASAMVTFRSPIKDYKTIQRELMQKYQCRVRGIYENQLNAIRVSCAYYNTKDQIDYLAESIEKILA